MREIRTTGLIPKSNSRVPIRNTAKRTWSATQSIILLAHTSALMKC